MATGTAANLLEQSLVDARIATKLIDVDFTGVQGDNAVTVRCAGSSTEGTEMPKGASALNVLIRNTNAPGGGGGDLFFAVLEVLIGAKWYQIIATTGIPFNASATDIAVANAFTTQRERSNVPSAGGFLLPFDAAASAGLLLASGDVSVFGWQAASRVRLAINATHAGVPAGSANAHAELWLIPHRGTTR